MSREDENSVQELSKPCGCSQTVVTQWDPSEDRFDVSKTTRFCELHQSEKNYLQCRLELYESEFEVAKQKYDSVRKGLETEMKQLTKFN